MGRFARIAFLACVALLPWSWVPPFPWLHEHAQWSDVFLGLAAALWAFDRLRCARLERPRPLHLALGAYLAAATLSCAANASLADGLKLAGIASLVLTALLAADFSRTAGERDLLARVVVLSTLGAAAAAWSGAVLQALGVSTRLVGTYGDLAPGAYARAQAGLTHPNLLASYLIFAWSVVAADLKMPRRLRGATLTAVLLTMPLTFSRGLLSLPVAVLVARADTRRGKLLAAGAAALVFFALAVLTLVPIDLDPTRFWEARLTPPHGPRRAALTTALATLAARPLVGCGPACHPGLIDGAPFDAHCTPVNLAATLGLPALAAFAGIVWSSCRRGQARPRNAALLGGCLALLLDGLAQDVEDFRHVWVLFGLTEASRARAEPSLASDPADTSAGRATT